MNDDQTIMELTARIVSAHVANNIVSVDELGDLIKTVRSSLLNQRPEPTNIAKPVNIQDVVQQELLEAERAEQDEQINDDQDQGIVEAVQPVKQVVKTELRPAVDPLRSVFPEFIICLEDGKRLKILKRHLSSVYHMTPDQYREKWNLGSEYPMVAPAYAAHRSSLAKKLGLGRRPKDGVEKTVAKKKVVKNMTPKTTSRLIALATGRQVSA